MSFLCLLVFPSVAYFPVDCQFRSAVAIFQHNIFRVIKYFSFCIFSIILFFDYPQVFLITLYFAVNYVQFQPISIISENSSNNSFTTRVLSPSDYFPVRTRSFTNNLCSCYVFHLQISVLNIFPSQYVPIPSIFSFTNISPSSIFLHSSLPTDIFFLSEYPPPKLFPIKTVSVTSIPVHSSHPPITPSVDYFSCRCISLQQMDS